MYPQEITAQAVLINNKIIEWKISPNKYSNEYVLKNPNTTKFVEKSFIVNSHDEANEIFNKKGIDFLKKFKIHEDFKGGVPEYNSSEKVINDFEIIRPLKIGS